MWFYSSVSRFSSSQLIGILIFYPALVLIMHMCCYNSVNPLQDYKNCCEGSLTILVLVCPGPGWRSTKTAARPEGRVQTGHGSGVQAWSGPSSESRPRPSPEQPQPCPCCCRHRSLWEGCWAGRSGQETEGWKGLQGESTSTDTIRVSPAFRVFMLWNSDCDCYCCYD